MAFGGGDIHYPTIPFVIMDTHTVLQNMKIGGLIIIVIMIINRSSGLSSAILAHTTSGTCS